MNYLIVLRKSSKSQSITQLAEQYKLSIENSKSHGESYTELINPSILKNIHKLNIFIFKKSIKKILRMKI